MTISRLSPLTSLSLSCVFLYASGYDVDFASLDEVHLYMLGGS